jgi:hypothetical protein
MNETGRRAVPDITYRQSQTYEICVDGIPISSRKLIGPEVGASLVPGGIRENLLEDAIVYEERERSNARFNNAFGTITTGVILAAGSASLSYEIYQSNSKWIKAAYGLGAFVTGLFSYGFFGCAKDIIDNRAPETRIPTQRIHVLEAHKRQISA